MKSNKPLTYPINYGIASCYSHHKGIDPNNEHAAAEQYRSKFKLFLIAFAISIGLFLASLALFLTFKGDGIYEKRSREETISFVLAIPVCITSIIILLVSLNFGEYWRARRRSLKHLSEFTEHYDAFLKTIGASREEFVKWSEDRIRRICLATLETERAKVDSVKTTRGKASKLKRFTSVYKTMNSVGIAFSSVDRYIAETKAWIQLEPKSKPQIKKKKAKKSKPKAKAKKRKRVLEPAA